MEQGTGKRNLRDLPFRCHLDEFINDFFSGEFYSGTLRQGSESEVGIKTRIEALALSGDLTLGFKFPDHTTS